MANEASDNKRGIKRSWGFLAFVRDHGIPNYVSDFKDKDGKTYAALSFSSDSFNSEDIREFTDSEGKVRKSNFVTVSFSTDCPARSMEDVLEQKHDLQVVELQRDSEHPYTSYKLCAKGQFEQRGTRMEGLL